MKKKAYDNFINFKSALLQDVSLQDNKQMMEKLSQMFVLGRGSHNHDDLVSFTLDS